jgi:hypothetical protein
VSQKAYVIFWVIAVAVVAIVINAL